jgi:hypothetical protein
VFCILCDQEAKDVSNQARMDGTMTKCPNGHKVRFICIAPESVTALNDEQRSELARVARRHVQPDRWLEIPRDQFRSIELSYST